MCLTELLACIDPPSSPELENVQVNYYETNVTLKLRWTPVRDVSYNVTVEPQTAAIVTFIGSTAVKLTLYYNIRYRLNIVATLCNQSSTTTVVDHYLFGKSHWN